MTLNEAVEQLRAHAKDNGWDPLKLETPAYRDLTHNNRTFRVAFSRIASPGMKGPHGEEIPEGKFAYFLSISQTLYGAVRPDLTEAMAIARTFFPDGFEPVPKEYDTGVGVALKFVAIM